MKDTYMNGFLHQQILDVKSYGLYVYMYTYTMGFVALVLIFK